MQPRAPIWVGLVVGWLAADIVLARTGAPPPEVLERFDELRERHRLESERERMNARELRLLPGIGAQRALAIRAAREEHRRRGTDEAFDWTSVDGIGERTVERVDAWFAARAAAEQAPDPAPPGAPDQTPGNRSP